MGKNIVVLSGSPRRRSNTDKLMSAFIEGAESAGNTVTCFQTADMKISGCLGCNHCLREAGVCVQKDDMQVILDALRVADVLVMASPIYYFSVTAQLKLALDRTYALLTETVPIKKAVMLITCGGAPEAAKSAVSMFGQICNLMKWEDGGCIIAPRLHEPGQIDAYYELMQAKQLGINI